MDKKEIIFLFSLILGLISYRLFIHFVLKKTKRDEWIALILGIIMSVLACLSLSAGAILIFES